MNDSLPMCGLQSIRHLNRQLQQLVALELFRRDQLLERLALHQLHRNERLSLKFVDIVDGADVGMIERRSRPSLTPKPFQNLLILRQVRWQEFEGDSSPELDVFGLVDHAHATRSKLLKDTVMRNSRTDHR